MQQDQDQHFEWDKQYLHPQMVHFPMILFPLSLLFLFLWVGQNHFSIYLKTAYWAFIFGSVVSLPTVVTGILDLQHITTDDERCQQLLQTHIILGILIAVTSIFSSLYYFHNNPITQTSLIPGFVMLCIALSCMTSVQAVIWAVWVYTSHFEKQEPTNLN